MVGFEHYGMEWDGMGNDLGLAYPAPADRPGGQLHHPRPEREIRSHRAGHPGPFSQSNTDKVTTIEVTGLLSARGGHIISAHGIEKQLLRLPGIHTTEVNYVAGSATVAYDETATDLHAIEAGVRECGYHCAGAQLPRHLCAPEDQLAAGRTQEAHEATAHEMGHVAGMDMQAMARDMRNRFFIATAFTVPVFIYSPMGGMFTQRFDLPLNYWLFLLASVAVIYPVWPFVVAAWRALKNSVLNMAVLVVLSVGTGYLFSVGATFLFAGVQFYEAVAVLLVFILLGHWLEMRARAGASAAIRTMLDLAPPMAMVIRDGHETQLPTAGFNTPRGPTGRTRKCKASAQWWRSFDAAISPGIGVV